MWLFKVFKSVLRRTQEPELHRNPNNPNIEKRASKRTAQDAFKEVPCTPPRKKREVNPQESGALLEQVIWQPVPSPSSVEPNTDAISGPSRVDLDRQRMPPPASPRVRKLKSETAVLRSRSSFDQSETGSTGTKSTRLRGTESADEYDMEEARRRAAATELPKNSGVWEPDEKDLFFHLSYRGFEPILPHNWMHDFQTLPLSIFSREEEEDSLIKCHKSSEFRAIRALSELIEIGAQLRDRNISSPGIRNEPVLKRAATNYIKWALNDLDLSTERDSTALPVYTIVTMKRNESMTDVTHNLAVKMHHLAYRHRLAANIMTSIEGQDVQTNIHPIPDPHEQQVPVVYGLMICSTVLAVFTLNGHANTPQHIQDSYANTDDASEMQSQVGDASLSELNVGISMDVSGIASVGVSPEARALEAIQQVQNLDEDSGLRFIAHFDFSNASNDVWNALVVAIVAMQIRKTMSRLVPEELLSVQGSP